jgi:hypothetical protein
MSGPQVQNEGVQPVGSSVSDRPGQAKNRTERIVPGYNAAYLGCYYDIRNEQVIPNDGLTGVLPGHKITKVPLLVEYHLGVTSDYRDRCDKGGISAHMTASILSGLVGVSGAYSYYSSEEATNSDTCTIMKLTYIAEETHLNLTAEGFLGSVKVAGIPPEADPTHVVVGVQMGVVATIYAKGNHEKRFSSSAKTADVETKVRIGPASVKVGMSHSSSKSATSTSDSFEVDASVEGIGAPSLPTTPRGSP